MNNSRIRLCNSEAFGSDLTQSVWKILFNLWGGFLTARQGKNQQKCYRFHWSARLGELNSLDSYPWGYLKQLVCAADVYGKEVLHASDIESFETVRHRLGVILLSISPLETKGFCLYDYMNFFSCFGMRSAPPPNIC